MCRPRTSGSAATMVTRKNLHNYYRKRKKIKTFISSWDFDAFNGKFHTDYNV